MLTDFCKSVIFDLDEGAKEPSRAHYTDAGFDLYLPERAGASYSSDSGIIDTGVHVLIPAGCVGLVLPRSSISAQGVYVAPGVIDYGYTGSIKVLVYTLCPEPIPFTPGSRIAQLLILPCMSCTLVRGDWRSHAFERGEQGLGSSGR